MVEQKKTWLRGDRAVWRGQEVTLEAHQGQVPVRLSGSGDVVHVWLDQLRETSRD